MHPEVTSDTPDRCPKCGMKLLPAGARRGRRRARPRAPPRPRARATSTSTGTERPRTTTARPRSPRRVRARSRHGAGDRVGRRHGRGQPDNDAGEHALEARRSRDRRRERRRSTGRSESATRSRSGSSTRWTQTIRCRTRSTSTARDASSILARDDVVEPNLVWKDTVLVRTGETVDILLDVTNPGRWMAHCHIAEHHESGMMFSFDVDAMRRPQPRGSSAAANRPGVATEQSRRFTILDPANRPPRGGAAGLLRLFTSVRYDSLPGLNFPATQQLPDATTSSPTSRTTRNGSSCRSSNSRVQAVRGRAAAASSSSSPTAPTSRQVVVATGPFQVPFTPPMAADSVRGRAAAQHPYRSPRPAEARCWSWRRQHGTRAGACGPARDIHLAIGAADAAAAAHPRTGPVPLPAGHRPDEQDRGVAPRAASEGQGDAHRLQPSWRAQARHPDAAARPAPARRPSLRRRLGARGRRGGVGDRLPARPLLRAAAGLRRRGWLRTAWRHRSPRPVLPRPPLAAHARLGAAGLGQRRRAVHRQRIDAFAQIRATSSAHLASEAGSR